MIEVEFLTLDPKTFDNIQDLFTKYKDLMSHIKACGVDKSEEKQMVLTILSKLGPKYSVCVSTFHSVRLSSGATWKIPSLEAFIESMKQEQNTLINMRKIKGHLLYKMVEIIQIRNIKTKTKGNHMQIQRRKGTQTFQ
jgi:hypothetical protein